MASISTENPLAYGGGGKSDGERKLTHSMHTEKFIQSENDSDDHQFWMMPPEGGSENVVVDFRFRLLKVGRVDTIDQAAYVKFYVVYYWTDKRLCGWMVDPKLSERDLPPKLWGPTLTISNATGNFQVTPHGFSLTDNEGRLKRTIECAPLLSHTKLAVVFGRAELTAELTAAVKAWPKQSTLLEER